jgi:pimeloyl-ACP methyl ester carboxylesterase
LLLIRSLGKKPLHTPVDAYDSAPPETVILVHGTWASPDMSKSNWYQTSLGQEDRSSFVYKLNSALAAYGSKATCWAHVESSSQIFSWSGNNHWFDRSDAADDLARTIYILQKRGSVCHVVAHSHGGNILVSALDLLETRYRSPFVGRAVTLGTPFIETNRTTLGQKKLVRLFSLRAVFSLCR